MIMVLFKTLHRSEPFKRFNAYQIQQPWLISSLQVGQLVSNLPTTVWKNITSNKTISQLSSMFVYHVMYSWFEVELNDYRQQRDITTKLALTSALVLIKGNLLTTDQHKLSVC